ncbi:MAG: Ig-like domain-containing protein [Burkholderiales bacterium]|nr:Ig-like domain-containing protein [Burkholderiales bacterium]
MGLVLSLSGRIATVAGVLGLLAGCGGGVYLGWSSDDGNPWDDPPEVSLVASATRAAPGQPLRLAAAATDDRGIHQVQFYRVERDGASTRLGNDGSAPYEFDTTMPDTTAVEVQFYARAIDSNGQSTDSKTVSVQVQR